MKVKILKAYNFRLYPTKATECLLNKTFGCCRSSEEYKERNIKYPWDKGNLRLWRFSKTYDEPKNGQVLGKSLRNKKPLPSGRGHSL